MSRRKNRSIDTEGFTIIELIIATAIFAVILLILSSGILQITRIYYKGVTATNTQNAARNIINEVSQAIQFGYPIGSTPTPENTTPGVTYGLCVGDEEYMYQVGDEIDTTLPSPPGNEDYHGLVAIDGAPSCGSGANLTISPSNKLQVSQTIQGAEEFLTPHMRLSEFSILPVSGNPSLYTVTVQVTYGTDDVLFNPHGTDGTTTCSGVAGDQFCATATLSTVVDQRVKG